MSYVYLTGRDEHTSAAVDLLNSVLLAKAENDEPKKFVCVMHDSSDHEASPLEMRYTRFQSVFTDERLGTITLRPFHGIDINVRTTPIVHRPDGVRHQAYVEHFGDAIKIVVPYYFYVDRHVVSYRRWLLFQK